MTCFVIKSTRSWFIVNLQVKKFCDVIVCKKWNDPEQGVTRKNRQERASKNSKQQPNQKKSFFWQPMTLIRHSVILDSM